MMAVFSQLERRLIS
jgi:DNA invertase Pin-like site-specific DNA recombinase